MQENDVAGNQFHGRDDLTDPIAQYGRADTQGARQCVNGAQGIEFLDEANDGVKENNAEDDGGIHPTLQGTGDQSRYQQNINQRIVKLGQEQQKWILAFLGGQAVCAKLRLTIFRFLCAQAFQRIRIQCFECLSFL